MEITKSSFYPVSNVDKLSNLKRYYRIEKDGKIIERILLDIPDSSMREHLIAMHYLKHSVMLFHDNPVGVNIISRDAPWDFKIELSTKEIFNLEITSVSDDTETFRKFKNEERYLLKSLEQKIPFHELVKLNNLFPKMETEEEIENHRKNNVSKNSIVNNPYYSDNTPLFLSMKNQRKQPLEDLIKVAIESKEAKKHSEKENTVLIIDNRTLAYEYSDLHTASELLRELYNRSPFREIWFYTGYASDYDGNNAEYSLAPQKVTNSQKIVLMKKMNDNPPDDNGIMYY